MRADRENPEPVRLPRHYGRFRRTRRAARGRVWGRDPSAGDGPRYAWGKWKGIGAAAQNQEARPQDALYVRLPELDAFRQERRRFLGSNSSQALRASRPCPRRKECLERPVISKQ